MGPASSVVFPVLCVTPCFLLSDHNLSCLVLLPARKYVTPCLVIYDVQPFMWGCFPSYLVIYCYILLFLYITHMHIHIIHCLLYYLCLLYITPWLIMNYLLSLLCITLCSVIYGILSWFIITLCFVIYYILPCYV